GFPGSIAPAEAPAAPSDLVITPDPGGALSCDLTWTNPDLTVGGDPLTELLEMRVYRDEDLVYTDTDPVIGGPGSYTDIPTESGLYDYCVVGYNSFGEGLSVTGTIWVGEDVPNVVEDLLLVGQYGHGHLTWINPTTGLYGGAFNEPVLGYHIERNDGVVFEVTGIVTEYWDTTIPGADSYYYDVIAYNSIGDGGTATSNTALLNAGGMLIYEEFDIVPPVGWYIDGLGQTNWSASQTNLAGGTAPELMFSWSPSFVGTSNFCSPPVNTVGMTELTLEFKYMVNDYAGTGYSLGVHISDNGVDWTTAWEIFPTGAIPATTETVTITDPIVGSTTFQIAFFLEGDSYNINYWYIDDVILSGPPQNPGLLIGLVTLNGGPGPVENVEITVDGITVSPNAMGYFEITLMPGTYDVTATLDGYE
ncbi:MAG: hypothetical protein KAT74_01965, partial [Candidatus Cloacimonetes bacterium]|nr:hypothetical protein [Candidatus Cloacimonadota bacterium]